MWDYDTKFVLVKKINNVQLHGTIMQHCVQMRAGKKKKKREIESRRERERETHTNNIGWLMFGL